MTPVIGHIMKLVGTAAGIVACVALGALGMSWYGKKQIALPPPQVPLIALEKLAHLATVKVNYSDIIEFTEKRKLDIPLTDLEVRLGGTKGLLVAKGDCTVATDLSLARYENINAAAHTLTLRLPSPKAALPRVNHAPRDKGGSYFYAVTSQGLEPIIPDPSNRTRAINNALTHAQSEVERVCNQADLIAMARKNTEAVLAPTFQAVGWEVTFAWK